MMTGVVMCLLALLVGINGQYTFSQSSNYILVHHKASFTDGNSICQSMFGTQLASIPTFVENNEVFQLCEAQKTLSEYCWIGYQTNGNDRIWFWTDGSAYTYENWASGLFIY